MYRGQSPQHFCFHCGFIWYNYEDYEYYWDYEYWFKNTDVLSLPDFKCLKDYDLSWLTNLLDYICLLVAA